MSKTEELLAVLDLPEDEQKKFISDYASNHSSHLYKDGNFWYEIWVHVEKLSLADLAFRLRDEAMKSNSVGWLSATRTMWLHAKDSIKGLEGDTAGSYQTFWLDCAQPIHWILAALIAKETK